MKASVLDMRNKMSQIIKALDRNENVTILYHGKEKAVIVPIQSEKNLKVKLHPFFGMLKNREKTVQDEMDNLRGGRFDVI